MKHAIAHAPTCNSGSLDPHIEPCLAYFIVHPGLLFNQHFPDLGPLLVTWPGRRRVHELLHVCQDLRDRVDGIEYGDHILLLRQVGISEAGRRRNIDKREVAFAVHVGTHALQYARYSSSKSNCSGQLPALLADIKVYIVLKYRSDPTQ